MTMFLAPYTAIADIDGSPLDAGFLFFGEYGKDPELFPVEVFWDADFTVPAAQPIRTRNGYPVRNGSPTKVYLKTAEHSIVIKNRNSAFILVDFKNKGWDASFVSYGGLNQKQVNDGVESIEELLAIRSPQNNMRINVKGYHAPTLFVEANPYKGGGTFVWDETSTATPNNGTIFAVDGVSVGRWIRQMDAVNRVTPYIFGAKGDGVNDDLPAILAAINSFSTDTRTLAKAGPEVYFPAGDYYISDTLHWRGYVKLIGDGSSEGRAFPAKIIVAAGKDGICLNSYNTSNSSYVPNTYEAAGSIIEGLNIKQAGFVNNNTVLQDYNPTTQTAVIFVSSYIPEGTSVKVLDDFLRVSATATIVSYQKTKLTVKPLYYPNGVGVGSTVTGATSGATATIWYVGYDALGYVLGNVVGTFISGEDLLSGSSLIKTEAIRNYVGDVAVLQLSNVTGTLKSRDILIDVNKNGSAIRANSRFVMKDCALEGFPINGVTAVDSSDLVINANLIRMYDIKIDNMGMHGVHTRGSDVNAGSFYNLDINGCRGYGVFDKGFLGNYWFGCHVSTAGLGGYFSEGSGSSASFVACYEEGGLHLYPFHNTTSKIGVGSMLIGATQGNETLSSDTYKRNTTILKGTRFKVRDALYVTGGFGSIGALGTNSAFAIAASSSNLNHDTLHLVNRVQPSSRRGVGIGFYLGTNSSHEYFKDDNSDTLYGGSLRVMNWVNGGARFSLDLLAGRRSSSLIRTVQSGTTAAVFKPTVTGGVITKLDIINSGAGYADGELALEGTGEYSGFTGKAYAVNGKVVYCEIVTNITGASDTTLTNVINATSTEVSAGVDNAISLGVAANRWSQVYAGAGTINTSDGREKQQIRDLSEAEKRVAVKLKSQIKAFKFNDAVSEKGDKARIHFGVIAQEVKAAFESEGLVAEDYAILCYDEWEAEYREITEEITVTNDAGEEVTETIETGEHELIREAGNRYGVRYEELLAFIISNL